MKVAFIGNSHIAAYRAALDRGYQPPDNVTVVFFGSAGERMATFGLDGTTLRSTDESVIAQLERLWGTTTLDLKGIDVVALTGMGVSTRLLGVVYKTHRSDSMAPGDYLVSDDTFRQAAAGLHQESALAQLSREIRSASPAMIVGLPQPLPSEAILMRPNNWVGDATRNGDGPRLAALAIELRRDELGLDLVV
ncbi:MAG TPA: hypothetical protein VFG14_00310, partial [Chthoniobacteraceae bacterium]|nr:hypothetical protein [Chthoniobacteraceae bacterium]